ncbi:PREDICTED: GTPase IMAP family member 8-like [Branchiostoma belcheri]|uniref:GTPase IMAP family member 8-like n=1 Tax=Branchiostoma belcheri TaxID=7741 RepID=A0A6P4YJ90_BRABE|nr:PREDICTED: GTPase IMAP family member 8-like [Branchiostoma belcheri]
MPIIVELYSKVMPNVTTSEDLVTYSIAREILSKTERMKLTNEIIKLICQVKDSVTTATELLNTATAVERLQELGPKVCNVMPGSVIFHVRCYDLSSLAKVWFEHRNGKLAITLRESLLTEEILQLIGEDIETTVETTIHPDDFKRSLMYLLRGRHTTAIAEYPVFMAGRQPMLLASTSLDALHLITNRLHSTKVAMEQLGPIWQVAWQLARERQDLQRKLKDQALKAMETRGDQKERKATSQDQGYTAHQPVETTQKDIKQYEAIATSTSTQQQTTFLLVGCKGNGKSHTGNTILGQEVFKVTRRGGTETSSLCSSSHEVDGVSRKVTVVDTPGVSQEMTESEFEELVRAVKMVPEGFDAICLVWDYNNSDRNEDKEVQVFQSLHRLFGDGLSEHIVILVTHAQQEDIPEFIESLTVNMKAIAEKANTVIAIDNKLKGESSCQLLLQHCPTIDTKYTSSDLSSECQIPPHADLHMVLIGKSGVGKSSTGNSIIGKEVFKVATVAASVTTKCNFHIRAFKNADSKLSVLDTPGLFATHTSPNNEEIQKMIEELCKMLTVFYDGIHALILVISGMSRFTEEDNNTLKIVQQIFGERFLDHTIVLITGKDGLKSSKEEYLESTPPTLRDILNKCQERCIFFDNVTKDATVRRKQLAKLVTVAQEAVKEKNGPYTGQGAQEPLFEEGEKMMNRIISNLSKEMPKDVQGPDNSGGGETKHPQHAEVLRSENLIDRARQYAASDEHEEYHLTTTAKSFFQTIKHIFLF